MPSGFFGGSGALVTQTRESKCEWSRVPLGKAKPPMQDCRTAAPRVRSRRVDVGAGCAGSEGPDLRLAVSIGGGSSLAASVVGETGAWRYCIFGAEVGTARL